MPIRPDLKINKYGHIVPASRSSDDGLPPLNLDARLTSTEWFEKIKQTAGNLQTDTTLRNAEIAHKRLVNGLKDIIGVRSNRDPKVTDAAHIAKVDKIYRGFSEATMRQFDTARHDIKNRHVELQTAITDSLGMRAGNSAPEIRSAWRQMTSEARKEFLNHAIEDKDGELLGAVLTGHPVTTGMSRKEMQAYRQKAGQRHAPELLALQRALESAEKVLFESMTALVESADSITARELREKYEQQSRKAAMAEAAAANAARPDFGLSA